MKATEQYFPEVLFFPAFESVDEILKLCKDNCFRTISLSSSPPNDVINKVTKTLTAFPVKTK